MVLLIDGKSLNILKVCGLQCHNVHTKFHENLSVGWSY